MTNQDFLERAFAVAEGGSVRTLDELRTMLGKEGYTYAHLSQVRGVLGKQLMVIMATAKPIT
jgi:hypothetical protein